MSACPQAIHGAIRLMAGPAARALVPPPPSPSLARQAQLRAAEARDALYGGGGAAAAAAAARRASVGASGPSGSTAPSTVYTGAVTLGRGIVPHGVHGGGGEGGEAMSARGAPGGGQRSSGSAPTPFHAALVGPLPSYGGESGGGNAAGGGGNAAGGGGGAAQVSVKGGGGGALRAPPRAARHPSNVMLEAAMAVAAAARRNVGSRPRMPGGGGGGGGAQPMGLLGTGGHLRRLSTGVDQAMADQRCSASARSFGMAWPSGLLSS
jgi:hypothetical protein